MRTPETTRNLLSKRTRRSHFRHLFGRVSKPHTLCIESEHSDTPHVSDDEIFGRKRGTIFEAS